jgi:uncharacterized membrane protein YdjX (TVP38/TMEM64 family)
MSVDPIGLDENAVGAPAPRSSVLRFLPVLLIACALLAIFGTGLHHRFRFEVLFDHWTPVTEFIAHHAVLAPLIFICAYIGFVLLSLPGVSLFSVSSGLMFGWFAGGLLSVTAGTIGAMLVFLAARTAFGGFLARKAGSLLSRIAAGFQRDAFNYLLFLRLVPAFPFWAINLAPALLGVPLRTYAAATVLGFVPGTFAFACIGAGLEGFMTEHVAERAACVAAGGSDCAIAIHLASLVSPYTLLGLGALGIVALIPVVLRFRAARAAEI